MENADAIPDANTRPSLKTHPRFNNYQSWKKKLRENCFQRVREDRSLLLWKMRLPNSVPILRPFHDCQKDLVVSAFQDIVSDELNKFKYSSSSEDIKISIACPESKDLLWEYDGLRDTYQSECEDILLEMQRIFYEDLKEEPIRREPQGKVETWEDVEDEFLAQAVYEHMQLNDEQVQVYKMEIWCPICKQGELQEKDQFIKCTGCRFQLNKGNEITLDFLRTRLADAHGEHFDRGCKLKPVFCVETRFEITALYIFCQGCSTFEVVI